MSVVGSESKKHFNIKEVEEFREDAFTRVSLFDTGDLRFNMYCIIPGQENSLHKHPGSDEILYFTQGTGECVIGDETYQVKPGDVVLCPKDAPHSIRNTGDSENMVCVLAQAPLPCEHVYVK
ncbi:hypothetical protein MNBD_NITROSPINAE04-1865 [hydrothermal vent metagenome]|uniref:Cupin type-2 domain-containing protein n=1 Tax=hydrothermal vent metagenome TaxID=652676 RepID=A0A3B1BSV4_9ZZZZ